MIVNPVDTTVKLWEYFYKVRVPYLQSRTVEDIRTFGTNISGIKVIDDAKMTELITVMLTISQMLEYYKEAVPIRIVSYSDVKEIYQAISEHIMAWKQRLEKGINIGDAPIDDLILLDQFANSVYDHAKYQFTAETVSSLMAQHMGSVQRVNASNFFNHISLAKLNSAGIEQGITRINAIKEDEIPDRDSLGEFFKTRLVNIRRG